MIDFFIDCVPPTVTAQQKGVTTRGFKLSKRGKRRPIIVHYKKAELEALEAQMIAWFRPHAPAVPMEGPIRCEIRFIYPWTEALKKKRLKGALRPFVGKDTKPDRDNITKLPTDVLTACKFWHDDAQVCGGELLKGWGDRPGIHVTIQPFTTDYVPPGCEEDPSL